MRYMLTMLILILFPSPKAEVQKESDEDHTKRKSISLSVLKDSSEIRALTELIYCESRGESFEGKAMVGMVAINESIISNKPITEVVKNTQRYDGAKHFVMNRKITKEYIESYAAAKYCLYNNCIPVSVLYFYNPKTSTDRRFIRKISAHIYTTIGNHVFCHDPDLLCSLNSDF